MRARQRCDGADDIAHVGELRKRRRRQERADLEMPHAGAVFVADPALLRRRRRKRLHQLQAIPQANLTQTHSAVGINLLNAGHASLTAVFPVGEKSCPSSSARTADVSAPTAGTLTPSPMLAPFPPSPSSRTGRASAKDCPSRPPAAIHPPFVPNSMGATFLPPVQ